MKVRFLLPAERKRMSSSNVIKINGLAKVYTRINEVVLLEEFKSDSKA